MLKTFNRVDDSFIPANFSDLGRGGYEHTRYLPFLGATHDTAKAFNPQFLGVELETEVDDDEVQNSIATASAYGVDDRPENALARYAHQFNDGDIRIFSCKSDGSLDRGGVEIVTCPLTLQYHMQKAHWAEVLATAEKLHFRSHDGGACGLHVHVNRNSLGKSQDTQERTIALILMWFELHAEEVRRFSRRHVNSMYYCRMHSVGFKADDKASAMYRKSAEYKHTSDGDRYLAINLQNTATVEFRVFRGTLDPVSFAATLQFVSTLCKFCFNHTLPEVRSSTFFDVVKECKYKELGEYCKSRGLITATQLASLGE